MRQLRGKAWLVTLYFIVSDVLIGPGVFRVACSDPASDRSAWGRSGRVKNGELVNYRLRRANAPRTVMARHRDLSAEDLREWWNFVSRGKMMAKPRLADWKGMGIFAPFYLRESASFRRNRRAGRAVRDSGDCARFRGNGCWPAILGPDAVQALRRQRVALGLRSPLLYPGMKRGRPISTHGSSTTTPNAASGLPKHGPQTHRNRHVIRQSRRLSEQIAAFIIPPSIFTGALVTA